MKSGWFLPETPDVLAILCQQAEVTSQGMTALVAWANAEPGAAQRVRDLEHEADVTKRELRLALTIAFTTPIDAEDLYTMSERLDAVLNGAKDTVREAEVIGMEPDQAVAAMAGLLAEGARHLKVAFVRLNPRQAWQGRQRRHRGRRGRRRRRQDPAPSSSGSTVRRHRPC